MIYKDQDGFRKRLIHIYESAPYSIRDLAAAVGISFMTVQRIFKGDKTRAVTLRKVKDFVESYEKERGIVHDL